MRHELVGAMLDPAAYPHPVKKVDLVQTHISWVFLTGDFAYKIKKPVDFGFLDFSTLEKRRHFCLEELRLNRRLAPELYLDVEPVSRCGGGFLVGNDSDIIEYCLKMVQFDQSDLLDRRLERDAFDPAWMDELAANVAQFHAEAKTGPDIDVYGDIHFLREHIETNLQVAASHIGQALSRACHGAVREHCLRLLEAQMAQVSQRQKDGHIRECHGDLHLRNITLYRGRPIVFDCIEFNDEYRMIDTMNDTAFLVMDCDARGRPDLGLRFLSRYLEYCGDYDGLMPLPLYLSYRAGVRGKVACLLADELEPGDEARRAQFDEAGRYFTLLARYARPSPCRLIVIGGMSGSGKSHLALAGLKHERGVIIRSDATRKRLAGEHADLDLYGPDMGSLTYTAMFDAARRTIEAGFTAILDATFLRPADREATRKLAERLHVPVDIYWLEAEEQVLRDRIMHRAASGSDVSDADLKVLEMQLKHYQRPSEDGIIFVHDSARWPVRKADGR